MGILRILQNIMYKEFTYFETVCIVIIQYMNATVSFRNSHYCTLLILYSSDWLWGQTLTDLCISTFSFEHFLLSCRVCNSILKLCLTLCLLTRCNVLKPSLCPHQYLKLKICLHNECGTRRIINMCTLWWYVSGISWLVWPIVCCVLLTYIWGMSGQTE